MRPAMKTVNEDQFWAVMVQIRNLRAWALKQRIDPFAVRQALISALEIDEAATLQRGVSKQDLDAFDEGCRATIRAYLSELAREWT